MDEYIYEHGTHGRIVYYKQAEELEKEAFESGAKVILEWLEDGRLYRMLQLSGTELWRFEYMPTGKKPLQAYKAQKL